jgi:Holliday junction resolvasome RuvABC ATP-dependent DNA helicase subunit
VSRLSQRCARILRVRSVEHRVAAARQAAAEQRVVQLVGVARRLGDLRDSLRPKPGFSDGQSLHAMAEMEERLRRAAGELEQPLSHAEAHHEQATLARLVARTREDGAERLRDKSAYREESAAMLREEAVRPPRITRRKRS